MIRKIVIGFLGMVMSCSLAYAQNENPPSTEDAPVAAQGVTHEGNVSLDFRDADILNVLKILALKSGVNIVAGNDVTGTVTIQLNDVPWKQALEVILDTYGYAYEERENVIMVTTIDKLKQRREDASTLAEQVPLKTETFVLNFSRAGEIVDTIERIKSQRGAVDFDERTNSLIVTDTPQQLVIIQNVITKLDTTTPQVLIESKIIETTLSNTENLGIDWVAQATLSGSKRPTTWPFKHHDGDDEYADTDFPGADTTRTTSNTQFSYGTLNFSQAQAVLELLKTKTDTDILSNPQIVTLDNQTAEITVGSQYPVPTYTYNEQQARLQVSGWQYMDIGIIFNVTPHVNKAGFITVDVQPQITEILDYVTVENTSLPRLSNESTRTSVMVKDGETLIIAGLLKDKTINTKKKVPIIGDIPVLGWIFQKSNVTVTKTDLLIFVTPHIITPELAGK